MTIDKQIRIAGGSIIVLHFIGSAGGTRLSFDDNETSFKLASYYGSLDNVVFDYLTSEFMQQWNASGKDLYIKVDATRFGFGETLILSNFDIDVNVSTKATIEAYNEFQPKLLAVKATVDEFATEATNTGDIATLATCQSVQKQLNLLDDMVQKYYYANTLADKLQELYDVLVDVADKCAIDIEDLTLPDIDLPATLDVEVVSSNFEQGYYVGSTAFDVQNLKDTVTEQAFALSRGAEDNAAWPIKYYKSTLVRNINVLNNYELKSIQDSDLIKTVPAFYPKTKLLGKLDFDQFGIKYDEITDLHILAETFHRLYDDKFARPSKCDIIYIAFLDQFFEVTDCDDVKTATNQVLYYDIKLSLITDRHNVAKDSDLLDLSGLTDATNEADIEALHADALHADALHVDALHVDVDSKPVIATFTAKTWGLQKFDKAQYVELEATDNYAYGICYYENQWCKCYMHDDIVTLTTLADKDITTTTVADITKLPFAKYAMFDKELNATDCKMYYTSYTIIRTLQPLLLIELQTLVA